MNQLDAHVSKVLGTPYQKYGKWWVEVEYLCWSTIPSRTQLMFSTQQEAEDVVVGHEFLS